MPAKKKKSTKTKPNRNAVQFTKPLDEVPKYYGNNTNITVTAYDFKITFGHLLDPVGDQTRVDPKAIVFMSPQHAKAFSELLAGQIRIYEEQSGISLDAVVKPQTTQEAK